MFAISPRASCTSVGCGTASDGRASSSRVSVEATCGAQVTTTAPLHEPWMPTLARTASSPSAVAGVATAGSPKSDSQTVETMESRYSASMGTGVVVMLDRLSW